MRSDVEQSQRGNSLREIRAGVWLVAAASLILCVVAICLSRREGGRRGNTAASNPREAARQQAFMQPKPNVPARDRKHAGAMFTPESRQSSLVLNSEEAKALARRVANEKARELYGCEPFWNGPSARLVNGYWTWSDRRARGSADIEATVDFETDGSMRSVDVILLDNRAFFRQPMQRYPSRP